jgi:hypothetical protein
MFESLTDDSSGVPIVLQIQRGEETLDTSIAHRTP